MATTTEVKWAGEVRLKDKRLLPSIPAVYGVFQGNRVFYIGRSENLKARWLTHKLIGRLREMDSEASPVIIRWQTFGSGPSPRDEQMLIDQLAPELNRCPADISQRGRNLATITFHMWIDQRRRLRKIIADRNRILRPKGKPLVSVAELVREAVDEWLEKEGQG